MGWWWDKKEYGEYCDYERIMDGYGVKLWELWWNIYTYGDYYNVGPPSYVCWFMNPTNQLVRSIIQTIVTGVTPADLAIVNGGSTLYNLEPFNCIVTLWKTKRTIENHHFHRSIKCKWDIFLIAMLVYQRVWGLLWGVWDDYVLWGDVHVNS